jgi:CRP-like cAMP-binding protein
MMTINATIGMAGNPIQTNHRLILDHVGRHITLTSQEQEFFTSLLEVKPVPQKTLIQQSGKPCTYISYVNTGALRAYFTDADDKESTIMFAVSDWWITDMYSFTNEKPAMINIEALEDSEITQLSKSNLDVLFEHVPVFERLFRIMMQKAYIREQLRVLQNLSLTAEERYENFLSQYPQIAARVTQKQIASYLGITPEFLSAIRKNRSQPKKLKVP